MKTLFVLGLSSLLSGCVLAQQPTSCFTLKAVDAETGAPISNAQARVTFIEREDPWGNGTGKFDRQSKLTDDRGLVTFKGISYGPGGGGSIDADGYYQTTQGTNYSHVNIALNRWEPWNPTIKVKLRPKKNQVPMIKKYIEWQPVPNIGGSVGYDCEVGDWVSPYGKGVISDLILTTSSYMQEGERGSEARYNLSFSNKYDGIQVYQFPVGLTSSFKWPYEAPLEGYLRELEKFEHWDKNGMPDQSNYAGNNNYIFRVRSRQLEDGSIEACYGMIEGELEFIPQGKIRFNYWFNPDPQSRSLESDKTSY